MADTLTESFCERCGTRYTFRTHGGARARLAALVTIGRGLRLGVTSRSSLGRSLDAARSRAAREASAHQLDAFQRTFRFCLGCGQYVCADCWDAAAQRCRSCAADASLACPACGTEHAALARYCRSCGATLRPDPVDRA
jgi:hypothetical protein